MREVLQNKAKIALVTDPDRGREWAAVGGCWGPDRREREASKQGRNRIAD